MCIVWMEVCERKCVRKCMYVYTCICLLGCMRALAFCIVWSHEFRGFLFSSAVVRTGRKPYEVQLQEKREYLATCLSRVTDKLKQEYGRNKPEWLHRYVNSKREGGSLDGLLLDGGDNR